MSQISLESLLNLINNEAQVKTDMAKEAVGIVFENTQLMKGITTQPSNVVLKSLEAENSRMDKPEIAIETSVAINKITSSFPVYPYKDDQVYEDELFRKIS